MTLIEKSIKVVLKMNNPNPSLSLKLLKLYEYEGQTIQLPKEKGQTTIYKISHRKLKIEQHEPHQRSEVQTQVLRNGKQFLLH
jgi:hypothetical protein